MDDELSDDGEEQDASRLQRPIHFPSIKRQDLDETISLFLNGQPEDTTTAIFAAIHGLNAEPDLGIYSIPELIRHLSSTTRACHEALNDLTIFQQLLRAKHLIANQLLWDALEQQVLTSYQRGHWLASFRIKVEDLFEKKRGKITRESINPSFATMEDCEVRQSYDYSFTTFRARDKASSPQTFLSINDQMIHILADFFHIPLVWRYQAIFTHAITQHFGPALLLLKPVLDFTRSLSYHLQLPAHPTPTFVHRISQLAVNAAFKTFTNNSDFNQDVRRLQDLVEKRAPSFKCLFLALRSNKDLPLQVTSPIHHNLYSPEKFHAREFGNISHPRFRTFCLLIFLLLPLLEDGHSEHAFLPAHRAYLSYVDHKTDFRLPFRDRAASRSRILEEGGPFSQSHIQSVPGFFSALIYRGITHSTDFLLEQKTLFVDLNDWKTTADPLVRTKGEQYVCKANAYGTSARARQVGNVEGYWKAANDKDLQFWDDLKSKWARQPLSFVEFFDKINQAKNLRAFGPLTSYLLSADYATAKVIEQPTPEVVGKILHKIDGGGKAGLKLLDYPCLKESETSVAFIEVMNALQVFLTTEEQEKANFGPFFVEHALCKLKRFSSVREVRSLCKEWDVTQLTATKH